MVTRTEMTLLKERTENRPQSSMRSQLIASFRQKTDGIVTALFIDTNSRRVRESIRR